MKTHLLKSDFSYTYNSCGYTIQYKGQNIGGAGILGKSKSRGKGRQQDIQMNKESAERDINAILNGYSSPHYNKAIESINNTNLN